jgi:hypothetical protein
LPDAPNDTALSWVLIVALLVMYLVIISVTAVMAMKRNPNKSTGRQDRLQVMFKLLMNYLQTGAHLTVSLYGTPVFKFCC